MFSDPCVNHLDIVAKDLTVTDRIGSVSGSFTVYVRQELMTCNKNTSYSTNSAVKVTEVRNPDTNAAFYVTIHANSSSATLEQFKLHVNTSAGPRTYYVNYFRVM